MVGGQDSLRNLMCLTQEQETLGIVPVFWKDEAEDGPTANGPGITREGAGSMEMLIAIRAMVVFTWVAFAYVGVRAIIARKAPLQYINGPTAAVAFGILCLLMDSAMIVLFGVYLPIVPLVVP
jgi:hypothetical protein